MEFTQINSDGYGNPRTVIHYLEIADSYSEALKIAKTIGGRKFHNKQYGGGIVFQCWNTGDLELKIKAVKIN